jgi:hypothetical protein
MTIGPQLSVLEAGNLIQLEAALPELAYVFRHVLVRDAVYATLVRRERNHLHQAVGEVLESLHPDPADALPLAPQLGAHFAEAGDEGRALKYLTRAGDQAASQYANREAAQYYARALEIAHRRAGVPLTRLYVARGHALELSGDYAGALASYQDMETQARERRDEALELEALTAQASLGNVFTPVSDPVRGRAVLEQALQLARRLGDGATEARLLLYMLRRFAWTGETDQVIAYGEQAVAAARSLGLMPLLIEGLNELARWGYQNQARLSLTWQRLEEAHELLRSFDAAILRLENLIPLGAVLTYMGDFEQVRSLLPELHRVSQAMGYAWGLAQYHSLLGNQSLEQGNLGAAMANFEEGIRLGGQYGVVQAELIVCAYLSRAYAAEGETAAGLDAVRKARDKMMPRHPFLVAWPLAAERLLLLADGHVEEAATVIARARQIGNARDIIIYRLLLQSESELGLAQGNYQQVIGRTEVVIRNMRAEAGNLILCEALAYQGRALLGAGELEAALARLAEARALAESIGLRLVLWRVLAALADLETRRGNQAEAQVLRSEWRTLLEDLANRTGTPQRRAGFLKTREVLAALQL